MSEPTLASWDHRAHMRNGVSPLPACAFCQRFIIQPASREARGEYKSLSHAVYVAYEGAELAELAAEAHLPRVLAAQVTTGKPGDDPGDDDDGDDFGPWHDAWPDAVLACSHGEHTMLGLR